MYQRVALLNEKGRARNVFPCVPVFIARPMHKIQCTLQSSPSNLNLPLYTNRANRHGPATYYTELGRFRPRLYPPES